VQQITVHSILKGLCSGLLALGNLQRFDYNQLFFLQERGSLGRTRLFYLEVNEKWPPATFDSFPVKKSFIFICWNTNETLL
jgi:hypothetical protein